MVFGAALGLGGCATSGKRASVATVRGYANLDVLVRRHPGWAGLAQYDNALARVDAAALQPSSGLTADVSLFTLPPATLSLHRAPLAEALAGERNRLDHVLRGQVARLRERQSQARDRQTALDLPRWEREASAQYADSVDNAEAKYTQELSRLATDEEAKRLNLVLQIRALRNIVSGWDKSTPPTPRLNQARSDLAAKRVQLASLNTERRQLVAKAASDRAVEIADADRRRKAYVAGLTASEKTALLARDEEQVGSLRTRLGGELADLLHQEEVLSVPSAPSVGSLAAAKMPPGPSMTMTSPGAAQSLRLTQSRLREQRARWLDYLYSDTRAAVKDAAEQHHWSVTFGPAVPGEKNLTAPLAKALTMRVWKS